MNPTQALASKKIKSMLSALEKSKPVISSELEPRNAIGSLTRGGKKQVTIRMPKQSRSSKGIAKTYEGGVLLGGRGDARTNANDLAGEGLDYLSREFKGGRKTGGRKTGGRKTGGKCDGGMQDFSGEASGGMADFSGEASGGNRPTGGAILESIRAEQAMLDGSGLGFMVGPTLAELIKITNANGGQINLIDGSGFFDDVGKFFKKTFSKENMKGLARGIGDAAPYAKKASEVMGMLGKVPVVGSIADVSSKVLSGMEKGYKAIGELGKEEEPYKPHTPKELGYAEGESMTKPPGFKKGMSWDYYLKNVYPERMKGRGLIEGSGMIDELKAVIDKGGKNARKASTLLKFILKHSGSKQTPTKVPYQVAEKVADFLAKVTGNGACGGNAASTYATGSRGSINQGTVYSNTQTDNPALWNAVKDMPVIQKNMGRGKKFCCDNCVVGGPCASKPKAKKSSGSRPLSPWIRHVLQYQKEHGVSYKEALTLAKSTY